MPDKTDSERHAAVSRALHEMGLPPDRDAGLTLPDGRHVVTALADDTAPIARAKTFRFAGGVEVQVVQLDTAYACYWSRQSRPRESEWAFLAGVTSFDEALQAILKREPKFTVPRPRIGA